MVRDAEAHADEDKKRQEEIEAQQPRRQPDLLHREDAGGRPRQAGPGGRPRRGAGVAATKQAVEEGGKDRIEAAIQELTRASHRMAEVLYQKAAASAPPPAEATPSEPNKKDGDVIDAEVVDEK